MEKGKKRLLINKVSRRLNVSGKRHYNVPEEPNAKIEAKWQASLAELLRYIDDGFGLSKVNFENSYGFEVNGVFHRIKHAIQVQNFFFNPADPLGIT